jgi:soluble lytic murein transglycosylase
MPRRLWFLLLLPVSVLGETPPASTAAAVDPPAATAPAATVTPTSPAPTTATPSSGSVADPAADTNASVEPVSDTPAEAETLEDEARYIEVTNPGFPIQVPAKPTLLRHLYGAKDVASYFPPGPLADARAAFDRSGFARVLTLTQSVSPESLPVRFLRAEASLHLRDYRTAAEELSQLATKYPVIADRCLVGAATAREALGQYDAAAALLAQVPVYSRLWLEARLDLAKLLAQQKQRVQAAEVLEPLTQLAASGGARDFGAEALWAIADLAKRDGKRDQEKEALVRIWSRHPLSSFASKAVSRLGAAPTAPEAVVDRAELLVEAHRNRDGMRMLEPLLPKLLLPDPLACRARFVLGKALRKERAHTRAQQVLTPVAAQCTGEVRPRALYLLGTSQSIVAPDSGIETYDLLANDFPEHAFADDALFYAADLELKGDRPEAALVHLNQLVGRYPEGDFAAEGLFKVFWIERELGHLPEALAALDSIERSYGNADESYDLERARYWRARVQQEEQKDPKAAAQTMATLMVEHPMTYYGLRAREWLERFAPDRVVPQRFAEVTAQVPWPLDAGAMEDDPHFKEGVELTRLGFQDWADGELLSVKRTTLPAEPVRLLVRLISMNGDARSAHGIARSSLRRDLSGPVTPETRSIWEIAYPTAFRNLIEKHCKSAGLDPDLLQALMREESALDPRALSWAGALGLTQLMPSTARSVARGLKLRVPTPGKLLDPDLNIRLGAAYLGQLLRRSEGNPSYALASYNAGAASVDHWRAEHVPPLELDAWVEEIPLAETRGYVKRVLRSYNTYKLLYGVATEPAAPKAAVTVQRR